jgi:hypothetical protein
MATILTGLKPFPLFSVGVLKGWDVSGKCVQNCGTENCHSITD